jgi:1,4-dihydroxy-2-naphthoyl-CoA synthase
MSEGEPAAPPSPLARPLISQTGDPTTSAAAALTLANVLYEKKGAIAYVTVNRPRVLNALNRPTWKDLTALLEKRAPQFHGR